jgi:tetratricopeptide (TPR) repeat protein
MLQPFLHKCKRYFRLFCLFLSCFLYSEAKSERPGICLVMLVEDDADIIKQCLESTSSLIDCLSICDRGSQDNTVDRIKEFMKEYDIPGEVYFDPEHNGASYQANATKIAKQMLLDLGFNLENSYLLVLHPEMQLHLSPFFLKDSLKEDAYLILEQSVPLGVCTYQPHLLRANLSWECDDIANEHWTCHPSYSQEKLLSIKIEEPYILLSKLEKRVELLSEALEDNPFNSRALFHLAQTQASLKHYPESIKNFQKCLSLLQDNEEIWFCKLMIGQCYEQTGAWDQALYWYLEAFQTHPDRAESLQKIATYYRLRSMNDLAYLFANHGSRIPHHSDFLLSPFPESLNYEFLEEISIAAYYTEHFKDEGAQANLQLILQKNVPNHIRDQAYRNQIYYLRSLPEADYLPIQIQLPLIQEGFEEQYHPMNPTLQKNNQGFQVICRAVNYTQMGAKMFNTIDKSGIFRTKNFLINYDRQFHLLSQHEIIENLPRKRYRAFNIEGLDDCRLFEFQNQLWFTCTTNDTNPTGNFQISLCKLADQSADHRILVEKLVPLLGPDPYRCEKNWLPFVHEGQIHVIYSYDPFLIYRIDPETGKCETKLHTHTGLDLSRFRGSAPPIPWGDGYLLLIHEVVFQENEERMYLHRFLFLDQQFALKSLSDPFYFLHKGIEFCCGMQIDHTDQNLILTIGVEDHDAYFCRVPLRTLPSLLKSI